MSNMSSLRNISDAGNMSHNSKSGKTLRRAGQVGGRIASGQGVAFVGLRSAFRELTGHTRLIWLPCGPS